MKKKNMVGDTQNASCFSIICDEIKNAILSSKQVEQTLPNLYQKVKNNEIDFLRDNEYREHEFKAILTYHFEDHCIYRLHMNDKGLYGDEWGGVSDNVQRGVTICLDSENEGKLEFDFAPRTNTMIHLFPYADMYIERDTDDPRTKWAKSDILKVFELETDPRLYDNGYRLAKLDCGGFWLFFRQYCKNTLTSDEKNDRNKNAESFAHSYGYDGLKIYKDAVLVNKLEYED